MLKPIVFALFCFFALFANSQSKKYSPKLSINNKLTAELKSAKDKIYDAYKDCGCSVDTANKKIFVDAGYSVVEGCDYLSFEINQSLSVKVAHKYWGDLIPMHANSADPFPPFVIRRFDVQADRDPFISPMKGFLLKYHFKENKSFSGVKLAADLNGYINCHHLKYTSANTAQITATDSLQIMQAFLSDTSYTGQLKNKGFQPAKLIANWRGPWTIDLPGYRLTTYDKAKPGTDTTTVITLHHYRDNIIGGAILWWTYYANGQEKQKGYLRYAKFNDRWLHIASLY